MVGAEVVADFTGEVVASMGVVASEVAVSMGATLVGVITAVPSAGTTAEEASAAETTAAQGECTAIQALLTPGPLKEEAFATRPPDGTRLNEAMVPVLPQDQT